MENTRLSNLHIAISGSSSEIDSKSKVKIKETFADLFGNLAQEVSSTNLNSGLVELIYEIQTPVFNDENILKDFFSDLEVLLDELSELNPHFTQLRRTD